jgi:hypothetical protein
VSECRNISTQWALTTITQLYLAFVAFLTMMGKHFAINMLTINKGTRPNDVNICNMYSCARQVFDVQAK